MSTNEEVIEQDGYTSINDVNLISLDLHNLLSTYLKDKYTLDDKSAKILQHVLTTCPKLITNLNEPILDIISDNVIDSKDLPQFIILFKNIINLNIKDLKKIKVNRSDMISLIKSIMFILLDTNTIKTGDRKEEFKTLLSLSIQILESSVDLSESITCSWKCC